MTARTIPSPPNSVPPQSDLRVRLPSESQKVAPPAKRWAPRSEKSRRPLLTALVLALLASVTLSACSSDPLAEQYREGSGKNYIAGDGAVTEIPVADRGAPVDFSGTLEDGTDVTAAQYLGTVTVVNFWYAGCAPCRAEAPDLEAVFTEFNGNGATFLGVNVRDQPATATSFATEFGITYPSIVDVNSGSAQLAFSGTVAPNAVPTTVVLDREGRVASRILGRLADQSILRTLVRDTIAETE